MSDLRDKLPSDEVMRLMSKVAVEHAHRQMAVFAREFAADPRIASSSGAVALEAFAAALESTADRHGVKP